MSSFGKVLVFYVSLKSEIILQIVTQSHFLEALSNKTW